MRRIFLHGAAGREHGRRFELEVASPAEAVRALIHLRPPLREIFRKGYWRVIVGKPHIGNSIDGQFLNMHIGQQDLHIVPATPPSGSDDDVSIGKIIVGVVLIGTALVFAPIAAAATFGAAMAETAFLGITYGTIAMTGASMVLGGVAGLLSPGPQVQKQPTDMAAAEDQPSFLFNGVTNNTQAGGPVPLVFGTHLVGSIVISAAIHTEDIAV